MSLPAPIRVAVVGVGSMGRNHARVYSQLKEAELIAVVDPDVDAGTRAAEAFGCRYLPDLHALSSLVDAVSIAVPTSLHAAVAVPLLEAGVHCLIEKPVAATDAAAQEIKRAAARGGAAVQVGHIERYNPAFQELRKLIQGQRVYAVDIRRMSPDSRRIVDVDVVQDLMIHDLDLALDLLGPEVSGVYASGIRARGPGGVDHATAILDFGGRTIVTLSASRVSQEKVRTLWITAEETFVNVDFLTRQVQVHRRAQIVQPAATNYRLEAMIERVFVPQTEPLQLELQDFLRVVREGAPPRVGLEAGRRALALAVRIQRIIDEGPAAYA